MRNRTADKFIGVLTPVAASVPTINQQKALKRLLQEGYRDGWYILLDVLWVMMGANSAGVLMELKGNATKGTLIASPTVSANGITFNGTTQGMNSGENPQSRGRTSNDYIMGFHRRNTITVAGVSMGHASATYFMMLAPRNATGAGYLGTATNSTLLSGFAGKGVFCLKKDQVTGKIAIYKDFVKATWTGEVAVIDGQPFDNLNYGIGCRNAHASTGFTLNAPIDDQIDIAFSGKNMTEAVFKKMADSLTKFNRALGRAVDDTNKIIYEGNSFMASYSIHTKINTYLTGAGQTFSTSNLAVNGSGIGPSPSASTLYMLYSTRLAAVDPARNLNCVKDIVCFLEGFNDLYYYRVYDGLSKTDAVQACYDNFLNYCQGRVALGYKCVFSSIVTRNITSSDIQNWEDARQNVSDKQDVTTVNGRLRSEFTIATAHTRIFLSPLAKWNGCVMVDIGDDPNFGQSGQGGDATYYDGTGHPTSAMQTILSDDYFGPAIRYYI